MRQKWIVITVALVLILVAVGFQLPWGSLSVPAWLAMTLLAVLLSGSRHYLRFRVSKRVHRSRQVNFVATIVTLALGCSALLLLKSNSGSHQHLLLWSVLAGVAYPLATVLGLRAQSSKEIGIELYQALTHNGNLIAIPILILIFHERPSLGQWTAICGTTALLLTVSLVKRPQPRRQTLDTRGANHPTQTPLLWPDGDKTATSPATESDADGPPRLSPMTAQLILGTAMAYAGLTIINKVAMAPGPGRVEPVAFLVASNIVAAGVSGGMLLRKTDSPRENGPIDLSVIGYGVLGGILNAGAFYAMLLAYTLGNSKSATIAAILAASVFVATTLNTCLPADPERQRSFGEMAVSVLMLAVWTIGIAFLAGTP